MSFPTDKAVSVCLVAETGTKLGCSRFAQSHNVMNVRADRFVMNTSVFRSGESFNQRIYPWPTEQLFSRN